MAHSKDCPVASKDFVCRYSNHDFDSCTCGYFEHPIGKKTDFRLLVHVRFQRFQATAYGWTKVGAEDSAWFVDHKSAVVALSAWNGQQGWRYAVTDSCEEYVDVTKWTLFEETGHWVQPGR